MTERLLHFIWQFGYFNRSGLVTMEGEPVEILSAGRYNTNQGPDFLDAKIKIHNTTWAGHVELHIKSSDWRKHRHDGDRNYGNVILHVVWEHDGGFDKIPVLELSGRVSKMLLRQYGVLMNDASFIPCAKMIGALNDLHWRSWKDRLLAERLARKAKDVLFLLEQNNCHWEEAFWWLLARNFGGRINAAAFEETARSINLNLLARHKTRLQQLEAVLFGQAGLLREKNEGDDYYELLQREYRFIKDKYKLESIRQPIHFLRMRPGGFPTIRLAQLAALIHRSAHLFSEIIDLTALNDLKALLEVTANDYWHDHYRFGEVSAFKQKKLGEVMTDHIIINTIVPVVFAYGAYHKEIRYKNKALRWLEEMAAERNHITKGYEILGVVNKNALDSQALIELKNEYCNKKRCLECGVGNVILKYN